MDQRLKLQSLLETLGSESVEFQPKSNIQLVYPCIIYKRDYANTEYANNLPYSRRKRYEVTVIDRDPDSEICERLADLPSATFVRHFVEDNLNHDIYTIYS